MSMPKMIQLIVLTTPVNEKHLFLDDVLYFPDILYRGQELPIVPDMCLRCNEG